MSTTAVIQLHQREIFERNVTRALLAGVGAGALAYGASRLQFPMPLSWVALVGTSLAFVRGTRLDRLVLSALAVILPALPWLLGLSPGWSVALAGVAAGAVIARARVAEKGTEGSVATEQPGTVHGIIAAAATGALALAGTEVSRILSARMSELDTPMLINFAVSGATISLFAGIGSLATHLALKADPIEARAEELLASLSGDLATQLRKALASYRGAGLQLGALPREPAREELAQTLRRLMKDASDLLAEWSGVEASAQESAHADLKREIDELHAGADAARDPVAKRQLLDAAKSLEEELERLGEVRLKRERVLAKVRSHVALLERARVALIGMRSSHATVRAAEMSAVARKLSALALGQADEARLAHEVATGAELAAHEVATIEEEVRARVRQGESPLDPVAPTSGDQAEHLPSRVKE
jgi:hypothetical protein